MKLKEFIRRNKSAFTKLIFLTSLLLISILNYCESKLIIDAAYSCTVFVIIIRFIIANIEHSKTL